MLLKNASLYYISKFPLLLKKKEKRGVCWYKNGQRDCSATLGDVGGGGSLLTGGALFQWRLLPLACPGHRDAYPTCGVVEVRLCYDVAKLIYLCKER